MLMKKNTKISQETTKNQGGSLNVAENSRLNSLYSDKIFILLLLLQLTKKTIVVKIFRVTKK